MLSLNDRPNAVPAPPFRCQRLQLCGSNLVSVVKNAISEKSVYAGI